ncbi:MAG: carboxypeptidase-like regulatory domain-containing protein, partial [candidate division Zixibacteria bacterium]|nr:carboxypeptidase-like regulatory domain-containing protein [candidate division Zixibacteria bacterium]
MYRAARLLIATALIVSVVSPGILSQTDSKQTEPTGRISGRVVDGSTQSPVIGASVLIAGTERGSATDDDGKFTIKNIPVGSYVVAIRAVGYEPLSKTDIIVRPGRITHITSELSVSAVELSDIVVSAGYFAQEDSKPTSSTTFSGEEIRRAPGS